MAVTVGRTRFTLQQLIDHAIGRCKIPRQKIGAEHQEIAKRVTSLALMDLSIKVPTLWCRERLYLGMYQDVPTIVLPEGSIDLMKGLVYYRTAPRVGDSYISAEGVAANAGDSDLSTACVQTSINGNIQVQFFTPTTVTYVGVIGFGDNYYNLVFEASNDGLTWTQVQAVLPGLGDNATFYPDATWFWYELVSPVVGGSSFFRVRETSGGVLRLREFYLCAQPYDREMARLNEQQWGSMPNKRFNGTPLQFFLERTVDPDVGEQLTMQLWPVPDFGAAFASVFCVRQRYVADLKDLNNNVELPNRWYDAMTWWIAKYMAAEYEEVPLDREQYIDGKADEEIAEALAQERDNSPLNIVPDISAYTR